MTEITNIKSCDMLTLQKMLRSFMSKTNQVKTYIIIKGRVNYYDLMEHYFYKILIDLFVFFVIEKHNQ